MLNKIIIGISLLITISCGGPREIVSSSGLKGYEYSCSSLIDCEVQAKELCGSFDYRVDFQRKLSNDQINTKIICINNKIDWGDLND